MGKRILITAKTNPDLDGIACGVGYAEFLNKKIDNTVYEVGFEGDVQIEVKFVLEKLGLKYPVISGEYDSFILVDFSGLRGLPKLVKPEKVEEMVDHRMGIIEYTSFPNARSQIELVGAAATLIAEKFYFENIDLSEKSAVLLYLAIFSNSLNLKANVTTFRDKRIVKWLENKYKSCNRDLVSAMFNFKTKEILDKLEYALNLDSKVIQIGRENIGIFQLEVFGADKFLKRLQSIKKQMKKKKDVDFSFCTIADMKNGNNLLIPSDEKIGRILQEIIEVENKGEYLITKELFLRKEIIPLLQGKLVN